jgi:tetratricopeptide (TPR) repeat protein
MPSHLPLRTAPEEDDITALKKTQRSNHADAVDVGEQNASWLKDRGDYFFKTTNYKAAINAYTAALQIDAEHISCFSNRAACHLALEDYARCIDDSEQALALLSVKESTPACRWSSNATRALVRKGTAQLRLGMFDLAVQTLQQAIEIVAESDQLHADISGLLKLVETDQVSTLKKRADDLFMALDVEQAVALYEEAISIDAGCFQLHSNLAACRLKLDDYTACVESCNQAISCLLPRNESVFSDDVTRPKLPKLLIKPLTRRGSAHAWLHQYEKAYEDYRVALSLDPSNSQLQNDTNTLKDIVMQYIRAEAAMMAESNLKPAPER